MAKDGIFILKGSIDSEINRYKLLVKNDIEKSKYMYKIGEQLILLASKGEYTQFIRFTSTLDKEDVLIYFVAKALMLSLVEGHLMISNYILDNGYPISVTTGLPNILNDCLKELLDYQCVSIVSLLITKGFDVNHQEKGTWLAPLHLAIQRMLLQTVKQLIELGADVNIVANGDLMPLTLANQLLDSSEKHEIVQILINSGANESWRRDNTTVFVRPNNNASSPNNSSLYDVHTTTYTTMNNTQIKASPSSSTISSSLVNHINKENNIKYVRFTGNTNPSILSTLYQFNELKPKVTVYNGNGEQFLEPPPKVNREVHNNNIIDNINKLKISNNIETDDIINNNHHNMNGESIVMVDINNDSKLIDTSDDGAFLFTTG